VRARDKTIRTAEEIRDSNTRDRRQEGEDGTEVTLRPPVLFVVRLRSYFRSRGCARAEAVYFQPRGLEVYACHVHAGNIPTRGVPSNILARGEHSKIDSRLRNARAVSYRARRKLRVLSPVAFLKSELRSTTSEWRARGVPDAELTSTSNACIDTWRYVTYDSKSSA